MSKKIEFSQEAMNSLKVALDRLKRESKRRQK